KSENDGSNCCQCSIRRPRPVSGLVQLRAPPGGMSARPRAGSLIWMKATACMKPAYYLRGVVWCPECVAAFIRCIITDMGIHGTQ
ncbi:unnamed protein product, partial [Ectocarpus sp. 12 AP-2014]